MDYVFYIFILFVATVTKVLAIGIGIVLAYKLYKSWVPYLGINDNKLEKYI